MTWALDLDVVLDQYERVVFMQTNRENLGDRYREICLPIPNSKEGGDRVSEHYRRYYKGLASLKEEFLAAKSGQNPSE